MQADIDLESLYLAYPPHHGKTNKTDTAILYLTDIFGVQLVNNRLYDMHKIDLETELTYITASLTAWPKLATL